MNPNPKPEDEGDEDEDEEEEEEEIVPETGPSLLSVKNVVYSEISTLEANTFYCSRLCKILK